MTRGWLADRPAVRSGLLWAAAALLLWLALRGIDWGGVAAVLGGLSPGQILVLALVNTAIVLLFAVRWWLILRAFGYRIPFLTIAGYRLAAFSLSYFTPGPHLGGEPLQVYLPVRRDRVPPGTAAASVTLDKLLELAANFAFLAFGAGILASGGLLSEGSSPLSLAISFGLLALPLVYLLTLALGRRPVSSVLSRLGAGGRVHPRRWLKIAAPAERQAGEFIRTHRAAFLAAVLLSGLVWTALVFEYTLAIRFLGLHLGFEQVIAVITAARIAILFPMPAGLGALEAALVLVSRALGEGAALGASLSLLIRVRDVSFGLVGAWLGRRLSAGAASLLEQE